MSDNPRNIRCTSATLTLIPVQTRLPLKFGHETLTHVLCARVTMQVTDAAGKSATGIGETPLSVPWAWPSTLPHQLRQEAMVAFCQKLTEAWPNFHDSGHPIEIGHEFLTQKLPQLHQSFNQLQDYQITRSPDSLPWLAALICSSPFDLALHDAYGILHNLPTYDTYKPPFMNRDLTSYFPGENPGPFQNKFPDDFLLHPRQNILPAWHLVGGKDWLEPADIDAPIPTDGEPYLLPDWIRRDGLTCLKIKLRGNDQQWDYQRILTVANIALQECPGFPHLSADFNCTVHDPAYVIDILDRLQIDHPKIHAMILYVEQPFPYDLKANPIDVQALAAKKPLFMDESAHDWKLIKLGHSLGWNGVALKTCKTQTGALLSLCYAKAHNMQLMVQDLTNPMLAQIPHVLLAAHAGTIMGVETNAMQFYPQASAREAKIHPGVYQRRNGAINLSTLQIPGFGYQQNP